MKYQTNHFSLRKSTSPLGISLHEFTWLSAWDNAPESPDSPHLKCPRSLLSSVPYLLYPLLCTQFLHYRKRTNVHSVQQSKPEGQGSELHKEAPKCRVQTPNEALSSRSISVCKCGQVLVFLVTVYCTRLLSTLVTFAKTGRCWTPYASDLDNTK